MDACAPLSNNYPAMISSRGPGGEHLEHGVGPSHLAQRLRVAPPGQREQLGVLGGLRALREQLPVQGDASGDAVQVTQVSQQ